MSFKILPMGWIPLKIFLNVLFCFTPLYAVVFEDMKGNQVEITFKTEKIFKFEYSVYDYEKKQIKSFLTTKAFQNKFFLADNENFSTSSPKVLVEVDPNTLCLAAFDRSIKDVLLTRICPHWKENSVAGLTVEKTKTQNIFGLGQDFEDYGNADGDWSGKVRTSTQNFWAPEGCVFGNCMPPYKDNDWQEGGSTGDIQIPIMYAIGDKIDDSNFNFALFLDHIEKIDWNFSVSPWWISLEPKPKHAVGYFIAGKNIGDLRSSYMDMTGLSPLPSKRMFGLWMSEFSYTSWDEIETLHASLRNFGFPIEGYFLDLLWFGGVKAHSDQSRMGSLEFFQSENPAGSNFGNPSFHIQRLKDLGLGVIPIEEPYVSRGLDVYSELESLYDGRPLFAHDCFTKTPDILSSWWGKGSLMDWTHPKASPIWHERKRIPLIELGIEGHWFDLGEPEQFFPSSCYHGLKETALNHRDIHNAYGLLWVKGLAEGYSKYHSEKRPLIMSRTGNAGIQKYGAAIWSGDIGAKLAAMRGHMKAQSHMSLSGIDYYSSDIGGFHRKGDPRYIGEPWDERPEIKGALLDRNYSFWFANAMWTDFPARPHMWNMPLDGRGEKTGKVNAPDRVGIPESNLYNTIQRYEYFPYFYSLAYQASVNGTPIIAPMVYYHQNNSQIRLNGSHKMIGSNVLVKLLTNDDWDGSEAHRVWVYLPNGSWVHSQTGIWYDSPVNGKWVEVPIFYDIPRIGSDARFPYVHMSDKVSENWLVRNVLRAPTFLKAGAIVPLSRISKNTRNVFGEKDSAEKKEKSRVRLKIAANTSESSEFEIYDDNGRVKPSSDFDHEEKN